MLKVTFILVCFNILAPAGRAEPELISEVNDTAEQTRTTGNKYIAIGGGIAGATLVPMLLNMMSASCARDPCRKNFGNVVTLSLTTSAVFIASGLTMKVLAAKESAGVVQSQADRSFSGIQVGVGISGENHYALQISQSL